MEEFAEGTFAPNRPFAYSMDKRTTAELAETVTAAHPSVMITQRSRIAFSISNITWDAVVWRNRTSVVFTLPNAWDKDKMFHVGMLGPIEGHNFFGPFPGITFEDPLLLPQNFQGEISEGYINVYSSFPIQECLAWLRDRLKEPRRKYTVKVEGHERDFHLPFQSPTCPTCYGLHSQNCPFDMPSGSHVHDDEPSSEDFPMRWDSDQETNATMFSEERVEKAVKDLMQLMPNKWGGSHLPREDLVDNIIRRVEKTHFILVCFIQSD